jgi:Uncharacterized protein conserved in bacteria (DUF2334)
MRYIILRDDDTNAFTPVECLERLYRPFLERGLPVNLATIPKVRGDATMLNGAPEGFLFAKNGATSAAKPIGENRELVRYLSDNPGYHIAQHGYHHSLHEFESLHADDIAHRLDQGARLLVEAGFPRPQTFVAPYDKFSAVGLREAAKRFRVISAGWFEWRRLPGSWRPRYTLTKFFQRPHWRVGGTILLSHPGCLLSYQRPRDGMLNEVKQSVTSRRLTVLVTHWWEYFRGGTPDEPFIQTLHNTAAWLAVQPDLKVISFGDVADGRALLN